MSEEEDLKHFRNEIGCIPVDKDCLVTDDNLAILFASYFEDLGEYPKNDIDEFTGWSRWAMRKANELIDRILVKTKEIYDQAKLIDLPSNIRPPSHVYSPAYFLQYRYFIKRARTWVKKRSWQPIAGDRFHIPVADNYATYMVARIYPPEVVCLDSEYQFRWIERLTSRDIIKLCDEFGLFMQAVRYTKDTLNKEE